MMKRSGTRSLELFGSSSGKGLVEIESVVEVAPVSPSVSHAEAEAAAGPSSSHLTTSHVEEIDSPSRLEVESISRSASPPELRAALCIFRCRTKLELSRLYLVTILREG